jgi:hypothetical protein
MTIHAARELGPRLASASGDPGGWTNLAVVEKGRALQIFTRAISFAERINLLLDERGNLPLVGDPERTSSVIRVFQRQTPQIRPRKCCVAVGQGHPRITFIKIERVATPAVGFKGDALHIGTRSIGFVAIRAGQFLPLDRRNELRGEVEFVIKL